MSNNTAAVKRRGGSTALLCSVLALFASWTYRCCFRPRYPSTVSLEEAMASLRRTAIVDSDRDTALRIIRERVLDGIAELHRWPCPASHAAMEHVRQAVK